MIKKKKSLQLLLLIALQISILFSHADTCQSCSETKVKLHFRGICRIAGTTTAKIILGDTPEGGTPNVIASKTMTGGQIAGPGPGGRYYAASYECREWDSDVEVEAKMYQPITIRYEFVSDDTNPQYTAFQPGVSFDPGVEGNPAIYYSRPSSPALNLWFAGADGVWVGDVIGYVSASNEVRVLPCLCGVDANAGDGNIEAGSHAPKPVDAELTDSKPLDTLLAKCSAGFATAQAAQAAKTVTATQMARKKL
jgi:hypothetical protein